MTDRLYYTDAYRRSFDAEVTSCAAAGDRYEVTLRPPRSIHPPADSRTTSAPSAAAA